MYLFIFDNILVMYVISVSRAGYSVRKRGGETEKLRKHFATFQNYLTRLLAQREIFRKMVVKSTIFELQQSFLHIFHFSRVATFTALQWLLNQ